MLSVELLELLELLSQFAVLHAGLYPLETQFQEPHVRFPWFQSVLSRVSLTFLTDALHAIIFQMSLFEFHLSLRREGQVGPKCGRKVKRSSIKTEGSENIHPICAGHTAHSADPDASVGIHLAVHFPPTQQLELTILWKY